MGPPADRRTPTQKGEENMSKRRKVTIAVIIGVIVLLAVAALVWNHFSARPAGAEYGTLDQAA